MTEPRRIPITPAEARVVGAFMRDGASNRAVAERLEISEDTVKSHMKRLLEATGYVTRTELAVGIYRRQVAFERPDHPVCRKPLRPINHGTWGGYLAHRRRRLDVCDACEAARLMRRRAS